MMSSSCCSDATRSSRPPLGVLLDRVAALLRLLLQHLDRLVLGEIVTDLDAAVVERGHEQAHGVAAGAIAGLGGGDHLGADRLGGAAHTGLRFPEIH